jgi:hypothetical protein
MCPSRTRRVRTFVDGAELAGALHFVVGSTGPATNDAGVGSAHRHGVDPLGAALLVLDGVVALAAVVLLMRRPRTR